MLDSGNLKRSGAVVALLLLAGFVLPLALLAPSAHAQTVVGTVRVGSDPTGVAYDSAKGETFVANAGEGTVSVISNLVVSSTTSTSAVSSGAASPNVANLLPSELAPYAWIIGIILLFADGVLFGVAIKKAILSAILIVVAVVLAGFVGLALPFLSASNIETHILNIMISQARIIGPQVFALPIFWLLGLAIGLWKG
jgi:hypothetical protein